MIRVLQRMGWYTVRSAGSKGDFDVVAFRDGRVLLVQVKRRTVGEREFDRMVEHYSRVAQDYELSPDVFGIYLAEVTDKVHFRHLWGAEVIG